MNRHKTQITFPELTTEQRIEALERRFHEVELAVKLLIDGKNRMEELVMKMAETLRIHH